MHSRNWMLTLVLLSFLSGCNIVEETEAPENPEAAFYSHDAWSSSCAWGFLVQTRIKGSMLWIILGTLKAFQKGWFKTAKSVALWHKTSHWTFGTTAALSSSQFNPWMQPTARCVCCCVDCLPDGCLNQIRDVKSFCFASVENKGKCSYCLLLCWTLNWNISWLQWNSAYSRYLGERYERIPSLTLPHLLCKYQPTHNESFILFLNVAPNWHIEFWMKVVLVYVLYSSEQKF